VLRTQGSQEVLLVTAEGQSIRFAEDEVRSMGLPAAGVGGIKLAKKDSVIAAAVVDPAGSLVTLSAVGFCKRTLLSEYGSQGRNGSGIVAHKTTAKTGQLVAATVTPAESAAGSLIVVPAKGQVRIIAVEQTPLLGRGVQGKLMVETGERDVLSALWYAPGAPGSDDGGGDSVAAPAKAAPPAKPLTKPVQAGLDVVSPRSKAQPPAAAQPAVAEPAAPVKRPPAGRRTVRDAGQTICGAAAARNRQGGKNRRARCCAGDTDGAAKTCEGHAARQRTGHRSRSRG
jgi:hypothetical protein